MRMCRYALAIPLVLLGGCVSHVEVSPMPESPRETTPEMVTPVVTPYPTNRPPLQTAPPLPSPFGTPVEPTPTQMDAVQQDLADRGIDDAGMLLVSADRVTWNDGSWGCPAAGVGYTQAVVEGYRIVVEIDGQTYDYRFGAGPTPRLCVP